MYMLRIWKISKTSKISGCKRFKSKTFHLHKAETSEAPPAKRGSGDRAKRLCLSLPGFPFYNGRSHLKEITATPGWGIVFKVYTDSPLRKTEQVSQNSNFHIFRYPRSELETMVGGEQELPSAIHESIRWCNCFGRQFGKSHWHLKMSIPQTTFQLLLPKAHTAVPWGMVSNSGNCKQLPSLSARQWHMLPQNYQARVQIRPDLCFQQS